MHSKNSSPSINVMSVYTVDAAFNSSHLTQSEVNLYGSIRLGIWNANKGITVTPDTNYFRGNKRFELNNHLGNVPVTIADKRLPHTSNNSTIDYYEADISTASDYYLGGMELPRRSYNAVIYAYGFDGKRMDNEIHGEGNAYDFESRIYDPRTVTWYSTDPLQKKYPNESPYNFVSRNPILYADKDGRDKIITITIIDKDGSTTQIQKVDKNYFKYYADGRYDGAGYYYFKADIHQNLTIDQRNNTRTYSSEVTNRQEISLWDYSVFSDLFKSGDQSGKIQFGYRIYGNGHDMDWQKGLPTAAPGSESLDLGEWLNFVGGLREGASPSDLLPEGKLKNILEKVDKVKEAVEKTADAVDATNKEIEKNKNETNAKPDSAKCPACKNKQDSGHIDGINGSGTFKKLREVQKTEKTKTSGGN